MEKFEYNGIWWLPEQADKTVPGTLKFDPKEGAFLDLIGSFKDITQLHISLEPKIILGFAEGKKITLYKCYESGSHLNLPGFLSTSFWVSVVFVGCHFAKEEEVIFDSLSLNYSHLAEWTWITGFNRKIEQEGDKDSAKFHVSYSLPDKVEAKINKLSISLVHSFKEGGDGIEEVILKQTTFVKIEPETPLHIEDYQRNILYHIQNFLSLGIGQAVYPLAIKGRNNNCKMELQDKKVVYDDISIFYSNKNFPAQSKRLHPLEMFFAFGDIAPDFEKYLNAWFSKTEFLGPVYDLYFAILYSPKMYLQFEFLSLVQALEAYHRRKYEGKYVTDDDYKEIYATLTSAIPQNLDVSFKTSLKEKVKYLNDFSLRKRLKKIIDDLGDIARILIKSPEALIEDIVNTRNYLTHYDKSLEGKEKNGNELYILVERMKFLLEMCFLLEIGMLADRIKILIDRNRRYQHLAKQN